MLLLLCLLKLLLGGAFLQLLGGSTALRLEGNAYNGVLDAINPFVPEDQKILDNLKEMITEASSCLFNATHGRAFIGNVKVLIPATWKAKFYAKPKQEMYTKADIIVAPPYWKHGKIHIHCSIEGVVKRENTTDGLRQSMIEEASTYLFNATKQRFYFKTIIPLTWTSKPEYKRVKTESYEKAESLSMNGLISDGESDEYNSDAPFYVSEREKVEATRCSAKITGEYVFRASTGKTRRCTIDPKTGLYETGCQFVPEKMQSSPASIMYMQSLPSVTQFCDRNNHNTEATNMQNKQCSYRSTWEVIMDSADFANSSLIADPPPAPIISLLQTQDRDV